MMREFLARRFGHYSLGALLLVALLVLTACGSGTPEPTPTPEIRPTSTLIPTLVPLATPVPVELVATTAPAAAEAAETAEEVATPEEAAATEEPTATEEVTATEETTATEEVTESAETTEEITASTEVTATEAATETHEGHGATDTMTETVTATEEISPTTEVTATGEASGSEVASDARVLFLQPTANGIVPLTFTVVMSYTGVTVAATEENVEGAGHLQILIDRDFVEAGQPIPSDDAHLHFDDGATTAELSLTPGSHILRLQYADNNHLALEGDQYRHEINVNVVEGAPEQAVRIVSPSAGATVPTNFTVILAATGLSIEPAGSTGENSGHLHVLIDEPYVAEGEVIPADGTHIHLGQAQLTTTLSLEPGTYLLRVQFADGEHRALAGEQYRAEIPIIVEEGAPAKQVMFVKPGDHATVTSPFLVGWAASGLIIEPAGAVIRPEGGHLHLLIDEDFVPAGEAIPMDESHLHFGKGQTSTELTLEPGQHTLRLQMADGTHVAQAGPNYRDEITVTVK